MKIICFCHRIQPQAKYILNGTCINQYNFPFTKAVGDNTDRRQNVFELQTLFHLLIRSPKAFGLLH